ncbi:MAG: anaerobic ribonucleoside-triphosphate reductase activating protein [Opitutaceae bacterium]|nr:anaerobic ribonucleoside-triphosphate reductase activating protein [Opitutaceae bacterium]
MKIGGFHKHSVTDYPGHKAAVIYTQGCNWRCPYCFYRSFVIPSRFQPSLPEDDILRCLADARSDIDAVVITGGEPTIQPCLSDFLRRVKKLGFKIKLETHGGRPAVLAELISEKLLDYIALDIKGPLHHYSRYVGTEVDPGIIELSLDLVLNSGVEYEIRTTLVGGLHTVEEVRAMAPMLAGSRRVALQAFKPPPGAKTGTLHSPSPDLFHAAGEILRDKVEELVVRV